jgi:hypothetical protein
VFAAEEEIGVKLIEVLQTFEWRLAGRGLFIVERLRLFATGVCWRKLLAAGKPLVQPPRLLGWLDSEVIEERFATASVDVDDPRPVSKLIMGLHQGAVAWLRSMPQGDPALAPLQDFGPPGFVDEAIEQALHAVLENSLESFALEGDPIVIEAG